MREILTFALAGAFAAIGLLHLWWARKPMGGDMKGAVPEIDGKPAFRPGRAATAGVAVLFLATAGGLAVLGGLVAAPGAPRWFLLLFGWSLALVLLARAIGDFRLLGVFKKPSPSAFARLDTLVYSPFCALLALGVGTLAATA